MKQTIFLIFLLVIVIIGFGSIYIINETEQAIVTQFGKPVGGAKMDAGLHFKIPIIQKVIKFDKRILEWDGSANEIPTLDNKYIFIDAFARWRISDALQFYKSAKNEMLAQSRLDDILDGAVRDEIANRTMVEIVRSSKREMVIQDVESSSAEGELPNTFVPGRNLIFLTFAAAYAYQRGIKDIIAGVCQTDYSGYPDCRQNTIEALQVAVNLGMEYQVKIHTPLMWMTKAETVHFAKKVGALEALAWSHTCYNGKVPPCGECPACGLRAKGFDEAGIMDPLIERTK